MDQPKPINELREYLDPRFEAINQEFATIKLFLNRMTSFMNKGFGFSDPELDKIIDAWDEEQMAV